MWLLLLSRRSDPSGTYIERRELVSGQLSIGRRAGLCDWVIEDDTGMLSRQHARFSVKGVELYVTDLSTNGIALNQDRNRIAANMPVLVRVGDKLLLNEIVIEIADPVSRFSGEPRPGKSAQARPRLKQPDIWFEASTPWQDPAAPPTRGHDPLAGSPPAAAAPPQPFPTGAPPPSYNPVASPLDEAFRKPILAPIEPVPNMFDILVEWNGAAAASPPLPASRPAPVPASPQAAPAPAAEAMVGLDHVRAAAPRRIDAERPRAPGGELAAAWSAFCEGAEIAPAELDPPSLEMMRELGAMYRQVVLGLSDLIRDRASFKHDFRVERTEVDIGPNNPMKHMLPYDAAKMMLNKPLPSFLGAEDSVRDGLEELKRHQLAMLAGVQHALRSVFEQLSPATVESTVRKLDASKGPNWLGRGTDPWAVYQTMFQTLEQEAGSSASGVMSTAFREGYEAFLRRH